MPKESPDCHAATADQARSSYVAAADRLPPTARGAANAQRNPDEWVTGDAPMTPAQAALLMLLAEEAGETFDGDLSKSDASMQIEAWQKKAGRGHPKRILEEDQTDG